MKRLLGLAAALILLFNCSFAGAAETPLTTLDFDIVGVGLEAGPAYQAVPKGIATQVDTGIDAQGFDVAAIVGLLPKDYRVKAELTGPAFPSPKTLVTLPGKPFDIPTLALLGQHTLSNIRLVDGADHTLFGAVPQAVVIESINDPLITEVKTRPLTVEEMEERGVTFDSSNYTAYEFTAAIATESGQVELKYPVAIPDEKIIPEPEELPPVAAIGYSEPSVRVQPPPVKTEKLPQNLTVAPIIMKVKEGEDLPPEVTLPPIPGIVVIPGNIGFLHQYFSAMALVSNGAPGRSDLVIRDVQVKIILPVGADLTPGTDEAPGDDPLRLAKGVDGFFPRSLPVMQVGADGKVGTADDISRLLPAETGQADFTIEGLKEGTHPIEFEITAILDGLPMGPVTLTGHATGAVLVRNPDFALTMSHPATVRSGEPYDLFITVTNTSKVIANLVSLHLDPRALSGTVFAEGETAEKELETILPGSSETVRYRLVSQRTGAVTATVFVADEGVKGRFTLRTGVGERGIPLSPDSLILPYIGELDPALVDAVVGLLGQAWSVATAPAGALPADVRPIAKQSVVDRAYDFSEAGLRILLGDSPVKALEDFTFTLFGSEQAVYGLDDLRRQSSQGRKVNQALAAIFTEEIAAEGLFGFQAGFAEKVSSRPSHLSVVTGAAPVRVRLSDASGARIGGLEGDEIAREIPYGDQLLFNSTAEGRGSITLLTRLDSTRYDLEVRAEAPAAFDLGIVLPDASGTIQQWRFVGLNLSAASQAKVRLVPGSAAEPVLDIDQDGDGNVDRSVVATAGLAIVDGPPRIVAATQIVPGFGPGGDNHGRTVAVLFSETVTEESAGVIANYGVDGNAIRKVTLQRGGRMAFLLLRDGIGPFFERTLSAESLVDLTGNTMSVVETLPIRTTATGPGAVVDGTVREANGAPVPGAKVRLLQKILTDDGIFMEEKWAIFSEKTAAGDGSYHFDYVFRNGVAPFRIEAIHPATGEAGQANASVSFHGQNLTLDIFMKARGALSGVVRDEGGNPLAGATVQITTLNDDRAYNVTSDATGSYAFNSISVGPFNLKAIHQASLATGSVMGVLPEEGGAAVTDVTLYRLSGLARGNISGTVLDVDGLTPRAGVVVMVRGGNYQNWIASGADGGFIFTGVLAGNITVEAWDQTTGEAVKVLGSVGGDQTSAFKIIMPGTGVVEGQVLRGDGGSAEGLYVIAAYGRNQQHKKLLKTDAQGDFRLDVVPVGQVSLQVLDPQDFNREIALGKVTLYSAGETAIVPLFVEAKALATATIVGRVYRRDGTPWPFATIRLADLGNMTYIPYRADAQGDYCIANVALKTHALVVIQGSEIVNASASLWFGGQVKTVDLHAAAIGAVSGTVYDDPEKTYPAGADVALISRKPDVNGWLVYDSSHPTVVKSDPQTGRFHFAGVYEGSFTVRTSNVFRPTPISVSGVLTAAQPTAAVELVLQGSPPADSGSGGTDSGSGTGSGSGGTAVPVNALGSISGQVLMPDETPVGEGVLLTTWIGGAEVVVTTDPEGKFQFRPILPAGNHLLLAYDPVTTLTWQGNLSVPPNGDASVTARLLGRGALAVRVFDAAGTPAGGVAVTVVGGQFPNDHASGSTTPEGIISFDNLTEGGYAVAAAASFGRGAKGMGTILGDGVAITVDLHLTATGSVAGTFFKADGKTPIPGGRITLKRSGVPVSYTTTSSDPATLGRFVFDNVPLGSFALEGFDPTTERIGKSGGTLNTNGETVTTPVVVGASGLVKGVVLNYSGTMPVDRAGVAIQASGYNYTTTTGPDGAFLFAGVPAGAFTLDARDPGNGLHGAASGTIGFEGEVASKEIHIAPTGSIEGRVLLPDGVTPAMATVSFQGKQVQVDPASGTFVFNNLAAGASYTLAATENGSRRSGGTVVAVRDDGEVAYGEIILRGIGVVEGTVRESDGITPLPGAQVTLQAGGSTTDFSDFEGKYHFANVPQGSFSLKASHPQRQTAAAASGKVVSDNEVVTVDMKIGPIAAVTGTVLLWDGIRPAAGGGVKFSSGSKEFTTVIDGNGHFSFSGIPIPCVFSLYMEDADGIGIGKASGNLTVNGEVLDVGTIILDEKPIAVVAVNPAAGSIDLPCDQGVTVVFSEPADPATVTASSVYLARGSAKVAAQLVLDADHRGATIQPNTPLVGMAFYQVVVTTGLKDVVGRPLAATFTSGFTTIDNVPPQVKNVSPTAGQIEVAPDAVVRLTFSETIDPARADGIRLLDGNTPVAVRRDWVLGGTVAILTPLTPMRPNAGYTVEVIGIGDLPGNLQVGTFVSSFKTVDTIAPTIVALEVPAGADLLTGNTVPVSVTVTDSDVALVDFFVDGERVATDSSAPYSFQLLLAQTGTLQLKAIAQDKVGNRGAAELLTLTVAEDQPPTAVFLTPAEGTIVDSGSTVSVSVTATDDLKISEVVLAASGAVTATQTRSNASGKAFTALFTLAVPAAASPGGAITLTAVAKDAGGKTSASVQRTLYVRDGVAPTLTLASPGQSVRFQPGQTGNVAIGVADNIGATELNCSVAGPAVGGQSWALDPPSLQAERTFSFDLQIDAAPHASVTVACTAKDAAGNVGSGSLTLQVADVVPPQLTKTNFADKSWGVATDTLLTVTFDEPLAPPTVNAATVRLATAAGEAIPGSVGLSTDKKTISFLPAAPLVDDGRYVLTIDAGVADASGNLFGEARSLAFATLPANTAVIQNQGTATAPFVLPGGFYRTVYLSNSYVVLDGPIGASAFTLENGSVVTHRQTGSPATGRVDITAETVVIDTTSRIDVSGCGYSGAPGNWFGISYETGRTLGNTITGGSTRSNGGSYGGLGGVRSNGSVNVVYGDPTAPNEYGSGGGGYYVSTYSKASGGNGGGLLRLKTDFLELNGEIKADGYNGLSTWGAGGSGGGIRIDVGQLNGIGKIYARGGAGNNSGGGGGGRIAIYFDTLNLPKDNILASGGKSGSYSGGAGTVYLKRSGSSWVELSANNDGDSSGAATAIYTEQFSGNSLYLGAGNFSVSGSATSFENLTIDGGTVYAYSPLTIIGTLELSNGAALLQGAVTSVITQKLEIVADTVEIDATSRIDVSSKGYAGGYQAGQGITYGNAATGGSNQYCGGSYGGYAGYDSSSNNHVNALYGDVKDPNEAGSGGGGGYSSGYQYSGGRGGGLLRLKANTLHMDGTIYANGQDSPNGAGSGGGIKLDVETLSGGGHIYAHGGNNTSYHGAGGGGRIAIYYDVLMLSKENIFANGGDGNTSYRDGGAGTIFLKDRSADKAELIVSNAGRNVSNYLVPLNVNDFVMMSFDIRDNMRLLVNGELTGEAGLVIDNTVSGKVDLENGLKISGDLRINDCYVYSRGVLDVGGSLVLEDSATLTPPDSFILKVMANRVDIDATSKIDVSGHGYAGGRRSGNSSDYGRTLGNTTTGGSEQNAGGSYGGQGGSFVTSGHSNVVYGDLADPNEYGSGGGGRYSYNGSQSFWSYGGSGGGLVRLTTNILNLEGYILADGEAATDDYAGGGSGGGIRLDVGVLNGSGGIYARGGNSSYEGAGGGGRIAIYYDTLNLSQENILASGGQGYLYSRSNGGAGTVYLKSSTAEYGDLVIDNNDLATDHVTPIPTDRIYVRISIGGCARPAISGTLQTLEPLTVFGSNNVLVVGGGLSLSGGMSIENAGMTVYGDLTLKGDLLINSGWLSSNARVMVPGDVRVSQGSLAVSDRLNIAGVLSLTDGGTLTHFGTSVSNTYRLAITAAQVDIDATSKIDVSGRGYAGGRRSGNSSNDGRTLGNTANGGSNQYAGGSYGGQGGSFVTSGYSNAVYGDLADPNEYGSGGGGRYSYNGWQSFWSYGGNGGGLVRLTTNILNLEGNILADGGEATDDNAGGGSGGGVRLDVGVLNGNGAIYARGGTSSYEGGGGGGRIAIYYDTLNLLVENILANGGRGCAGYSRSNGGAGTVYLKSNADEYGDLVLDNNGLATTRTTPISGIILASLTVTGGAQLEYLDKTAPHVTGASIENGAINVPTSTVAIEVYFDEPLASDTVTAANVIFKNSRNGFTVAGNVALSTDRMRIIFTPESGLHEGILYELTISSTVTDLSHNALGATYRLTFGTEGGDYTAPQVVSSQPENGQLTRFNESISLVLFDDISGVDANATISESYILDSTGGKTVDGSWQWYATQSRLVFTPVQVLTDGEYQVTVHPTDLFGNCATISIFFTVQDGLTDQDGIVAKYTMETIESETLIDERGRFNGTVSGAVQTKGSGGIAGEALEFSAGQYVTIPKEVISGDQFGIAFFERSPADANPADGFLLGDSENPLNLFFRRYPETGANYTASVAGANFWPQQLEVVEFSRDGYHFIVINKGRDGRVEVFVDDLETPAAAGTGSTFNGLLADLWLGNRADMTGSYVGRIDELTIAARPFDLEARRQLREEVLSPEDGLVARYPMNGIVDATLFDTAGHHNGVIVGAEPLPTGGSEVLHFVAAEADRVDIPAGIPTLERGTIAVSVKLNRVDSGVLLSNRAGSMLPGMFQLDLVEGGVIRLLVYNGEIWSTNLLATSLLPVGTRLLLTVTWDETGKKIYLDDQEIASTVDAQPLFEAQTNTLIGNLYDLNWGLDGDVDELRLYDRALSGGQIIELYQSR